jgi:hypothetical protein
MNVAGVGFYSSAQGASRPAWAMPVGSWTMPGAPLQPPTHRLADEHVLVGGDEMAVVKKRPAGHDGAGRLGVAFPRALLSPARSMLIMSHSCISTQAKMLHDGM